MKKFSGIALIVLGAIILLVSYLMQWTENNAIQFTALALMIVGLIVHIVLQKRLN